MMDNYRKLPEPDDDEEERVVRYLVDKLGLRAADPYRHLLGEDVTELAFQKTSHKEEK
jgi:hypothetical protein